MQQKNLHPAIGAQLKKILERNDIRIELKNDSGSSTYTVIDPRGKQLIQYLNGWDYGWYSIYAMGQNVAKIKWFENTNTTTPEQQAVFDIFDIIVNKYEEQEKAKEEAKRLLANMSDEDKALIAMLKQHTNESTKQK